VPQGVETHLLSNQAVMNFRDLRNIEAAIFIPTWFVPPYITRAGCYRALPAWKQAWHLNYQQCRLICNYTSQSCDLPNHRRTGRHFTGGRKNFALKITICPKNRQFALKLTF